MSASPDPRDLLPRANRILVKHNVLDSYGHVSMRAPEDPSKFYISRNLAPGQVGAEDIQLFTIDGMTEDPRKGYLEVFIHSEIYRRHDDVQAIVHSHSGSLVPFSVSNTPMPCVSHMAGFLAAGVPVFEIRDIAGHASDLLITNPTLGTALAECLEGASVALMRGHGAVIVGSTVPEVVHKAVFTVFNAKVALEAIALGTGVTVLTPEEGASAMLVNQSQIARAWNLWSEEVKR